MRIRRYVAHAPRRRWTESAPPRPIPVAYLAPRVPEDEQALQLIVRRLLARALRRKAGRAYVRALQIVTAMARPHLEGTLFVPRLKPDKKRKMGQLPALERRQAA